MLPAEIFTQHAKGYHQLYEKTSEPHNLRCPSYAHHICPYQLFSNYLKQYGSYGLHKILASGDVST